MSTRAIATGLALAVWASASPAAAQSPGVDQMARFEPPPWRILRVQALRLPIDAAAMCVPEDDADAFARLARAQASSGAQGEIAIKLMLSSSELPAKSALRPILRARLAKDPERRHAAIDELEALGAGEACALIEAARLLLLDGRTAEAAGVAALAADRTTSDPQRESARFHRAEALWLAGKREAAQAIYSELETPSLVDAGKLRALLDLDPEEESTPPGLLSLAARGTQFGAPGALSAVIALDAALRARDLEAMDVAIEAARRQRLPPRTRRWLRIVAADRQAALGRDAEALAILASIRDEAPGTPSATLASIRSAALRGDGGTATATLLPELRAAMASEEVSLARYAGAVTARLLLRDDAAWSALDVLTRAAYRRPATTMQRELDALFEVALQRITRPDAASEPDAEACSQLVEHLGWRRRHLIENTGSVEAFITLADCYASFGLHAAAEDVLRALVRRHGGAVAERVSLSLTRSVLAQGRTKAARVVAEAYAQDRAAVAADAAAWRLLFARTLHTEGKAEQALDTLDPLLRREVIRFDVLELAARAALDAGTLGERAAFLGQRLLELQPEAPDGPPPAQAKLALDLASALRAGGSRILSRSLYEFARRGADGPALNEARYRLAALERDRTRAAALIERAAQTQGADPWARLARESAAQRSFVERVARGGARP